MFTFQTYQHIDMGFLGIYPLSFTGLLGILTAPLIHGNLDHILSNTIPLLFLSTTLYIFYNQYANQVFLQCYFITNLMVWVFGRPFYHIGASGLIYGLAFFLISFGIFKRNLKTMTISIIIILMYGGLIYGINPSHTEISWESHLFGAIVGVGSSFGIFKIRNTK